MSRGVFTGARNREKVRSLAIKAREIAFSQPMERSASDAIEALADAVQVLCDELEKIERGER
jgi:hypothetical protein